MAADSSWSSLSAASRRIQSRYGTCRFFDSTVVWGSYFGDFLRFSDMYLKFDETDAWAGTEDDSKADYPCPFCSQDFDIVGLCIHIDDDHPVEARNGVCPVCLVRFGTDMVAHITMEHPGFFKMHRRRKCRRAPSGTQSAISFFRKELQERNLQSLFGGSSYTVPPSSAAPDPLLSSFINLPVANSLKDVQSKPLDEGAMLFNISEEKVVESVEPSLSNEDQKERTRRSEFVQGLLMSTLFDDYS